MVGMPYAQTFHTVEMPHSDHLACYTVNMPKGRHAIWSTYKMVNSVNIPYGRHIMWSICHIVNITTWSTCDMFNLPYGQHAIWLRRLSRSSIWRMKTVLSKLSVESEHSKGLRMFELSCKQGSAIVMGTKPSAL